MTLIAVTDSPFHSLEPAIAALKRVDPELRMAKSPSAADILAVARDADAVLVTYAKLPGDLLKELERCKVTAPAAGSVHYAAPIGPGAVVRDGQLLFTLLVDGKPSAGQGVGDAIDDIRPRIRPADPEQQDDQRGEKGDAPTVAPAK